MNRPGGNHADRRRQLLPRDYAVDPSDFGENPMARFHIPDGGDVVSAKIAQGQHALALAWRARRPPRSGTRDAAAFGVSSSVWSRCLLGERWMGETVMSALLHHLDALPRTTSRPSPRRPGRPRTHGFTDGRS
ncbi:hypothetical protein [Geodermatophilus saharensis]|uniref:hypothetical protein n=1 Tax=Geodermatophilus saharensis TaxID=1137994 RepID=UPI001140347F|nr:hypothetical protein [Geodermatophilus saharensis]